jgi:four helix bundle protein
MIKNDLTERLLKFSVDVILFLRKLPVGEDYAIIKKQLVRSSTSSGANYEEAQGATSNADFSFRVGIALKEMRESWYWLKIIHGIIHNDHLMQQCNSLIHESYELKNILGAICTKVQKRTTK